MAPASVSAHPLIKHKLSLLREAKTPPASFRQLISELTLLLGYEALRDLSCASKTIQTPIGNCNGYEIINKIALIPILRAGLGMTDPMLELIPEAKIWHLGMFRDEKRLKPVAYYNKLPKEHSIDQGLLLDPMLATGGSAIAATEALKETGINNIAFLGILGSQEGVHALSKEHPDVKIHLCGIDHRLNQQGYIVPGLGDAGDRQYNT